ncbi:MULTISPECIES: TetR/AcrR family transcriptional regulator [Thermoactinomyces]|uniref:TetR/AcrR family transcriptional regulator n=1 Tax=Thermoactinomyces daqus TaxID=1329516 RepID=A0A7W1XBI6_9BACL|nr:MULTISPECIES: TetR/AcrR family transcriptional regulator [Thermoactinomyces]MBA4543566.1 TetR/AcrR family transcriptional regulator [Thermoactinomyces daqus]MBH8596572.1 TetR/AcrR family transcriptional regulator [Thermoactinomyces sp. CICC 10523]MBH8603334.1 TetR/AcrR family transcriptional regulator [Thermoactinomyces sp. CICC 10522]MBH8607899.1 TetR/AcrR family transcriptional regulator [Thermoactinomyces sp. CICC 10521]
MNLLFLQEMPLEARDKILFAALELFTSQGYKNTTILEVVELARVSKTTFYQHFNSKEELLVHLFKQLAEEIIAEIADAVEREEKITYKAYAGIRRYLEICISQSRAAKLLLVESVGISRTVEKVRREAHQIFAGQIFQTVQGVVTESLSKEEIRIISQAMVGAINEVVVQNLFSSEKSVEIDALARLLNRIVVGSFVNLSLLKA